VFKLEGWSAIPDTDTGKSGVASGMEVLNGDDIRKSVDEVLGVWDVLTGTGSES